MNDYTFYGCVFWLRNDYVSETQFSLEEVLDEGWTTEFTVTVSAATSDEAYMKALPQWNDTCEEMGWWGHASKKGLKGTA